MTSIEPISPQLRKDILRLIKGARVTLTPPSAWTRHVPARNKHNQPVIPFDKEATCYDIVGAIMVIAERTNLKAAQHSAILYLRQFTDGKEIGRWNDEKDRTHADVLTMLDKAINQLNEEISNA